MVSNILEIENRIDLLTHLVNSLLFSFFETNYIKNKLLSYESIVFFINKCTAEEVL
jgi:hypothetical protein